MPSPNGPVVTFLNKAISVYALCLIVIGTTLNLFSIYICRRPRLKNTSTFIILSFFFFFSAASLYTWNLDTFLALVYSPLAPITPVLNAQTFNSTANTTTTNTTTLLLTSANDINNENIIESLNIVTCKIFTFMQYFSLQAVAWLLTYINIDQNIKVYFPNVAISNRIVVGICSLITAILFATNFHILLFVGVFKPIDAANHDATLFACYETNYYKFYPMWDQVHTFLYCFVPFFVMIVSNLLLARRLITATPACASMSKSSVRKKRSVSVFCVAFSIMFIFCTLPQKICFGYFYDRLSKSSGKWYGQVVLRLANELNFSFTGLNFMFQLALNNIYRNEFLSISRRVWLRLSQHSGQIPSSSASRPPVSKTT